jgi:hypothetical protein
LSGLKPLEIPFRNYQPAVVYIFSVIKITKLFILGKPLISKTGFEITYRVTLHLLSSETWLKKLPLFSSSSPEMKPKLFFLKKS